MHNEIREACERALDSLNTEPIETAISDRIADLATLAYEKDLNVADVIVQGCAHALAIYIEGESDDNAAFALNEFLFPFTGERQFAEYIAEKALVLAGAAGRVQIPEWGC